MRGGERKSQAREIKIESWPISHLKMQNRSSLMLLEKNVNSSEKLPCSLWKTIKHA